MYLLAVQEYGQLLFAFDKKITSHLETLSNEYEHVFIADFVLVTCISVLLVVSVGYCLFLLISIISMQRESLEILKLFLEIPKDHVTTIKKNSQRFMNFCNVI